MTTNTAPEASGHPRLLLIDGHSVAYRAFYALPAENFSTSTGQHTNAVYGFTSMLINVLRDEQPTHEGPQGCGKPADGGPGADRPATAFRWKGRQDEAQGRRGEQGRACRLQETERDQGFDAVRQGAGGRGDGEEGDAGEEPSEDAPDAAQSPEDQG